MSVALPLSGTWRRVIRRDLGVVKPQLEPAKAAEHQAAVMAEIASQAQEAALAAHGVARSTRLRAAKEFRFAALSDGESGLGVTFWLERGEMSSPANSAEMVMAAMQADEEVRWRLYYRAKAEADAAGARAVAATTTARVAQQAATEAQEAARVAGLSPAKESWPANSYDVDAAAFLEQHLQGEAA
ncbi:MAG: hypothetical protein ACYCZN_01335 [Candidatus Dormibacteria bacterium]